MSYEQPAQHQVFDQQFVKPPTNGMAITALVRGILAVVVGFWSIIPLIGMIAAFLAFLPAVLAAVFGHIGRTKANRLQAPHAQGDHHAWEETIPGNRGRKAFANDHQRRPLMIQGSSAFWDSCGASARPDVPTRRG